MRVAYQWLARLIALGVLLQMAFIAFGTFDLFSDAEDGRAFTGERDDYNAGQMLHAVFGEMVIPLLALLLLIVSFFAKLPRGVTYAAALFVMVVAQVALGIYAHSLPSLGMLHGALALAILVTAVLSARLTATPRAAVREPAVMA
jgi:heme A synthase